MQILFGSNAGLSPKLLYSTIFETGITVTPPPTSAQGPVTVNVTYNDIFATNQYVYVDTTITATCVKGCNGRSSGFVAVIECIGFATVTSASVNGAAAVVASTTSVGSVITATVRIPPMSLDFEEHEEGVSFFLDVQGGGNTAYAQLNYVRAPRHLRTRFNSVGSRIEMQFTKETSGSGAVQCSSLLRDVATLGQDPACLFTDPSTLWIVLGLGATILPQQMLEYTGKARARGDTSDQMPDVNITVLAPSVNLAPNLVMEGPSVIGSCDVAVIVASAAGEFVVCACAW